MFWTNNEWLNSFLIQLLIIIIFLIYANFKKSRTKNVYLIICLLATVPVFKFADGTMGSVYLIDLYSYSLLFGNLSLRCVKLSIFRIFILMLFIVLPFISTLFVHLFYHNQIDFYFPDFIIQVFRFLGLFILSIHYSRKTETVEKTLLTEYKYEFFIISLYGVVIFFSYILGWRLDAWNSLLGEDLFVNKIGGGSLYMYRASIGFFLSYGSLVCLFFILNSTSSIKILLYLVLFLFMLGGIVFSGSRQGLIMFFIISITYLIIKRNIKYWAVGIFIFVSVIYSANLIMSGLGLDEWIMQRYSLFLDRSESVQSGLVERNENVFNLGDISILGSGLGGRINSTESDYLNTILYFGVFGGITYVIFLILSYKRAFILLFDYRLKKNPEILLPVLFVLLFPFFGVQQWFIMTTGAHNSVMAYISVISFARLYSCSVSIK